MGIPRDDRKAEHGNIFARLPTPNCCSTYTIYNFNTDRRSTYYNNIDIYI